MFRCGHYLCFCYDILATAKCVRVVFAWLCSRYSPSLQIPLWHLWRGTATAAAAAPATTAKKHSNFLFFSDVDVAVLLGVLVSFESTRMCAHWLYTTFTIHIRSHKVAPVTHRTRDPMIYVHEYILSIFCCFFSLFLSRVSVRLSL